MKKTSLFLGAMVAALYMLFYGYDYLLQTSFSVLPQHILTRFDITVERFGFLSGAFFYGYVLFQIPLGYCLDRIGLKYTAILCVACCLAGSTLFYYADHFYMLFIARFLIGAGTASACVMSVYAVSTWLSPRYFPLGVGAVQTAACLGSIFGQSVISLSNQTFGWDATMQGVILFALILFAIYLFLPKNSPFRNTDINELARIKELPKLLVNKQIVIIAILGFISWAPVSVLAASWMVRLLDNRMGWTEHHAANLLVSFWIGLAVSSLLIGKISDALSSRKKVVIFAFIIQCACGLFLAIVNQLTLFSIIAVLFLLGAAASVQTLSFVLTAESVNKKVYGTAAALVNMVAAASGGVINPIFGVIVAHTGTYQVGLWIFPALSAVGIALSFFMLRETYTSAMNSTVVEAQLMGIR